MPIYEYECSECQNRFELLVFDSTSPACPSCEGTDLERLMSLSSVSSDGTRQRNLGLARLARKGAKKTQVEKAHAEHEAMHHHHR